MKELDHADRVIYLNTFAKSLAPSLRIGYMVLPYRLLDTFCSRFGFYSSTVPSFEQYTLARFLSTGSFERHVSRIRNLYKARRDALLVALRQSRLASMLRISGAEAGLHILLAATNGMSEAEMIQTAAREGVHVYGLSGYYVASRDLCPALHSDFRVRRNPGRGVCGCSRLPGARHGSQTGKQKNIKNFSKMSCIFRKVRLNYIHTKQLGKSGTAMPADF